MKKVIKIIALSLLLTFVVGVAIFYFVAPKQFLELSDKIVAYMNTPICLIGGSTLTIGMVIVVLVKAVYDRYRASIKSDLEEVKKFNAQVVVDAKEVYEKAEHTRLCVEATLKAYSTQIEELVALIVKVCETSPNAKIKAIAEEVKQASETSKAKLEDELSKIDEDMLKVIEEKDQVAQLQDHISQLEEQLGKLVEHYGREESND